MSYNIHKGIGGIDRKYRPERIVETIRHYNPDVALLQEVDDSVPRSRGDKQIELFADLLNFKYKAFQSNVKLKQGCYGNAILSHYPISNSVNIDLTVPPKKKRRGLAAQIKIKKGGHTRSVKFINVHFGLAAYERAIQSKRLVSHEYIANDHHSLPIIIGGDFNDLWQNLCRKVFLANHYTLALGRTKTFPAIYPSRALDRVFYKGKVQMVNSFAGHTDLAHQASDHLPIIVDFSLDI